MMQVASLPNTEGLAGMFAGISNGSVFCMGGANFPNLKPWQGGTKKWYDNIYILKNDNSWEELNQKMPMALGYGVAVSYQDAIIVAGGNNEKGHSEKVTAYQWNGTTLNIQHYPDLPIPLANMSGGLIGSLIVIVGGNESPVSAAKNNCYALDLENIHDGWIELPQIPGRERLLSVSAVYQKEFYVFSGETVDFDMALVKKRVILQDAYKITPIKIDNKWTGSWVKLAEMPRGCSAAASPMPVMNNGNMYLWGGVDADIALHKDPSTHPGISNDIYMYSAIKNNWYYLGKEAVYKSRVTLPVVFWDKQWLYISGEIKPAVRTNTIIAIKQY
jgi:N-acetylneuraminic acid mutarotase